MPSDNTHHIIAAAHRRTQATRRRAVAALRRINNTAAVVTFDALAREAGVSRSWLYTQPDLRAEVERLRDRRQPPTRQPLPDRQRCSEASLRQRLEVAAARIHTLETDNTLLRQALAEALGDRRLITTRAPRHDTPQPPLRPPPEHTRTATSPTPSRTQTRRPTT